MHSHNLLTCRSNWVGKALKQATGWGWSGRAVYTGKDKVGTPCPNAVFSYLCSNLRCYQLVTAAATRHKRDLLCLSCCLYVCLCLSLTHQITRLAAVEWTTCFAPAATAIKSLINGPSNCERAVAVAAAMEIYGIDYQSGVILASNAC